MFGQRMSIDVENRGGNKEHILRRVAGLFRGGAKLISMDRCTTIVRVRRQSQMHRQSYIPFVQYLAILLILRSKNRGLCRISLSRRGKSPV